MNDQTRTKYQAVRRGWRALLLGALLWARASRADADSGRTIALTLENDVLAGTDRHYTHGTRLMYLDREVSGPSWMDPILERGKAGIEVEAKRFGFALGQNIYTPSDISIASLMPQDRPYAGWLYGSFILQRRGSAFHGGVAVLDHLELNLGMVGPASLARETQIWVHEMINSRRPLGWDHQLRDEPGLVLIARRDWTLATAAAYDGWGADMTTSLGAAAGNVADFLSGGLNLRAGYRLPRDASGGLISPTVKASPNQGSDERWHAGARAPWGVGFFGGVEGRAVGRNIFLDGNTFRDSHSVDKEPAVADFRVGAVLCFHAVELTATLVYRTREFRAQAEANRFGSLSVGFHF